MTSPPKHQSTFPSVAILERRRSLSQRCLSARALRLKDELRALEGSPVGTEQVVRRGDHRQLHQDPGVILVPVRLSRLRQSAYHGLQRALYPTWPNPRVKENPSSFACPLEP